MTSDACTTPITVGWIEPTLILPMFEDVMVQWSPAPPFHSEHSLVIWRSLVRSECAETEATKAKASTAGATSSQANETSDSRIARSPRRGTATGVGIPGETVERRRSRAN